MSVFDKELIINGKAVRSPEQQVYKNMEDIADLQEKIKEWYSCDTELNSSSISVARANTNVPEGTEEGFLIDTKGNLFKITGNDDTNLLISFYASLQGPQGEDGAALNIDDTITSLTKVWSSKKTDDEIKGIINDSSNSSSKTWSSSKIDSLLSSGIAWTSTSPVDNSISTNSIFIGAKNASSMSSGEPKLHIGDLIILVDDDFMAKTIYRATEVSLTQCGVSKVCDVTKVKANPTLAGTEADLEGIEINGTKYKAGGGSTRYLHKIFIATSNNIYALVNIENNDNIAYDTKAKLSKAIYDRGATTYDKSLIATGQQVTEAGSPVYCVMGVYSSDGASFAVVRYHPTVGNTTLIDYMAPTLSYTISDNVTQV